ncbi:hypothetical protein [Actinospongicola halichondriae]|uniref:hypothetical protein n=1 Tax=Actinospongicola halichondriae TaxID=3236844 RepID=UPI003D54009B
MQNRLTTRLTTPLVVASVAFVAAGGYVHLTEWLDVYRDVPSSVPGAEVVTIGFPVHVAMSVVAVVALAATAWRAQRLLWVVVAATAMFQAGALAVLILSRTGTVLGWTEPTWNDAANTSRAVEIGALVCLATLGALLVLTRQRTEETVAG